MPDAPPVAKEFPNPLFQVVLGGASANASAGADFMRGLREAVEQSGEIHVAAEAGEGERLDLSGRYQGRKSVFAIGVILERTAPR